MRKYVLIVGLSVAEIVGWWTERLAFFWAVACMRGGELFMTGRATGDRIRTGYDREPLRRYAKVLPMLLV